MDESGVSKIDLEVGTYDSEHLKLYLKSAEREIAGRWESNNRSITFRPFLPLDFASEYEVTFMGERIATFRTPTNISSPPQLLAIHPAPDSLPENLLKIQLVFDREMQAGKSSEFVVIREKGQKEALENVFLDLNPELWSPGGDTLTLWLNPGRIKRDLIPNREEGNPLRQGTSYELMVMDGWKSAHGQPLTEPVSKTFYVTQADRSRIEPDRWVIDCPKGNSTQPLVISTNEPLDLLSAPAAIKILNASKEKVPGDIRLIDQQNRIVFKPLNNWNKGIYTISIEHTIEDISGNRIDRLFDEDLSDSAKNPAPVDKIQFKVE